MTASIPSGFSSDDLKKMLENAMPEPDTDTTDDDGSVDFQTHVESVVSDALDSITKEIEGPLGHKVAMMMICHNMFSWHNAMAERHMRDEEFESAGCWARDAGHFQVIHNILANISVGNDDFTCTTDRDE